MSETNVQKLLRKGNDQFTAKRLYRLMSKNPSWIFLYVIGLNTEVTKYQKDKSFVQSAFSVLSPLAQLALASVGPSHDEILSVIGMANEDELVEANTNNRINNLVDPSTITKATAAFLVNAIFFKLLEMPYEGFETSFVVVLPNKYDGIESLVDKLKDPNAFSEARSTLYKTNVRVTLPKFKIETTTDLKKVLQQINIKRLFEERQAHLNKLIKDEVNVFVSDAVQKAFIEVDEQGTEAAAANKFGMCTLTSVREPVYQTFNADHPFVFYSPQ